MTDRPTLETDAVWNNLLNSSIGPGIYNKNEWGRAGVMADVARRIERDRDALRDALLEASRYLTPCFWEIRPKHKAAIDAAKEPPYRTEQWYDDHDPYDLSKAKEPL